MTEQSQSPRPHLLLIAFYYPPSRASGVFRPLAMANYFVAQGWHVTVITTNRSFFELIDSVDASLEALVDERVVVQRVPFAGRPWHRDLRSFSWFRGNFPTLSDRLATWRESAVFPDRYAPWIPGVVAAGLRIHGRDPVDVVMATGNPFAAFGAAAAIGKLADRPYVLDYRDAWTLNQFTEEPSFPDDSSQVKWERRLIGAATRIVFVNEAQRTWHAQRHPGASERMMVVENGFDSELFPKAVESSRHDGPAVFGYVGTVTEQLPLEQFTAGWLLAREQRPGITCRIHGHLGFFPNQRDRILDQLPIGEGTGVTYEGAATKADLPAVYADLDALLMIIPSSRYVTAGKVYEYMATGLPLVTVHEPWTGAREPLRGRPGVFEVDDLEPRSVAAAIVAAADDIAESRTARRTEARRHAEAFTRARQFAHLDAQLRTVAP